MQWVLQQTITQICINEDAESGVNCAAGDVYCLLVCAGAVRGGVTGCMERLTCVNTPSVCHSADCFTTGLSLSVSIPALVMRLQWLQARRTGANFFRGLCFSSGRGVRRRDRVRPLEQRRVNCTDFVSYRYITGVLAWISRFYVLMFYWMSFVRTWWCLGMRWRWAAADLCASADDTVNSLSSVLPRRRRLRV